MVGAIFGLLLFFVAVVGVCELFFDLFEILEVVLFALLLKLV